MTDLLNGIEARNGRSPITPVGMIPINLKKDSDEIKRRKGIVAIRGDLAHANRIYAKELAFVRSGKKPQFANDNTSPQSDVEVFVNFDGITETQDAREALENGEIIVLAVTRNPPMHQGMEGREMGFRFVGQRGGFATIRCLSHENIPIGARLMWKAPVLGRGESNDPYNNGRKLAELEIYKPGKSGVSGLTIHQNLHRIMGAKSETSLDVESASARTKQSDAIIFDSMLSIGYSLVVLYLEQQGGNAPLSAEDKVLVAQQMGIIAGSGSQKMDKQAHEFRKKAADTIFEAAYDEMTGGSQMSDESLAFPLAKIGIETQESAMQSEIASQQAGAFSRLAAAFIQKDHAVKQRIFATAISSGKIGGDIDVHLDF